MAVESHLGIPLADYDAKIRTFIPEYEALLDAAAGVLIALDAAEPRIVDAGTGTGALAARCLAVVPGARVTGIDEDDGMLALAASRLAAFGDRVSLRAGSFADIALPACDAVVASLAFHHLRTAEAKRDVYSRCHAALSPGGLLVTADCHPSAAPRIAEHEQRAWRDHLLRSYTDAEAGALFAAWAQEDVYVPLPRELEILTTAGLRPDVVWRRGPFAVIAATRA
jgi:SAM-dependent methyltransferase